MRKFIFGVIAAAVLLGLVAYCFTDDSYHISDWSWKEKKPEPITWENLKTFVLDEDLGLKVEYPSTFTVDTTEESEVDFVYEIDDEVIILRCYAIENSETWDEQTAADSIAEIRMVIVHDSVVMKDMHPGYFYLKGYDDERCLGFYEQYIVDKDAIFVYELCYPKWMENRVRRLMDLVHNWDPGRRR